MATSERTGNFEFLKGEERFTHIYRVAALTERLYHEDYATCIQGCRRAMECVVKWIFSVDTSLKKPWEDNLASYLGDMAFRKLVGEPLHQRLNLIRRFGNAATHTHQEFKEEHALQCIKSLHILCSFVARCYSSVKPKGAYNEELLQLAQAPQVEAAPAQDPRLEELLRQNAALQEQLTALREAQRQEYQEPLPEEASEFATRKLYIDAMLMDAGWVLNRNWVEEVKLTGLPTKSGYGYADYVLYDDAGKPLAVVEAKKTSVGIEQGRQQAEVYAESLAKQHGRKPIIFLTNGFDTRIIDHSYPERPVASVYSKRDLEKLYNIRALRRTLRHAVVDKAIAGRYYQEEAIKATFESFERENRRKALLVMATGSGKTRTVIALCKALMEHGWVKNMLFLADRNALVEQAKRAFVNMLPQLSVTNLCEDKQNTMARGVFSTYNTMMNCIDNTKDAEGNKLFTCGHFDLLICDEAHRSIYNKYRDIFTYFDAPLVGLTATPKNEIDKNTYDIFDLEEGIPTYGYDLQQAVTDGYLVNYLPIATRLKFLEEGINYDDLSEEEKKRYEDTFAEDEEELPEGIDSAALNTWVFNTDTIKKVLDILMQKGLRVDYGNRIGKSIIFAKNHAHAEKVLEVFNKEYPQLCGQAMVIDNYCKFAQKAIDDFSTAAKLPQIAITVDMLDTGIDVPEVLNLVFFKKVRSYAKFWQMIGRGTRLCPGLLDGEDKKEFYIFDFCGNFEFFRMTDGKGHESTSAPTLQGALFTLKAGIASKLQDLSYQTEQLQDFRARLVGEMLGKVQELNQDNFSVRQHLRYVAQFGKEERYRTITADDVHTIRTELAPLIMPEEGEINALRFDALMYGIECAQLEGNTKGLKKRLGDLQKKAQAVASVANIPEVGKQGELLKQIIDTDYLEHAGTHDFEHIREKLRDLMKYIPREHKRYDTDFADDILSITEGEPIGVSDPLERYRQKAEAYLQQHKDYGVIGKLRRNVPLTKEDVAELEHILWHEIGTREDYEKEYGKNMPLGVFVRSVVGLDMAEAKAAFAKFLDSNRLDAKQIYFVNLVVEYVVKNGLMRDLSILMEVPFTNMGDLNSLFGDNMALWAEIRSTIESINTNAVVA